MLLYKYKGLILKRENEDIELEQENKNLEFKKKNFFTLDPLEKKYLYFSRPSELNDPFDCNIQISFDATDKEYLQWIKTNRKKIIPGYKLSTVAGIKKAIKESDFIERFSKTSKELIENNHVLSLTTDCMNESMWALYANNYNGICIGYNFNDSNFSFVPCKIEFSGKKTYEYFSENLKPIIFEEIFYDNKGENPLYIFKTDTNQKSNILYNLTHKKECWANENEYRAIIHDTDFFNMPNDCCTTKVFYEDSFLSEIIFGYKTPSELINYIIELVQKDYTNQIKFYKIFPNLTDFKLEKQLLEIQS
ncbi:hypothetical protein MSI_21470 [Treponema sp. JC4]|uniref:DUF2971 domain-containing protein n=1 Tax=Treponema sp. JC4 TaxID=1124982 RepID=UPI00025B0CAC|nr:DUF2971 domain-containing protein [Treponema sp. JC4]EID84362.1 hypothetical protein MSI_21470 [Treponema sp. JC4]